MSNSSGNGNSSALSSVAAGNDSMIWGPETVVILCASVGNILVGLPTNSWVLWLIASGTREALFSEIFTLNLAVLEVAFCLHILLRFLAYFIWITSFSEFVHFFSGLSFFGCPLFQGCICVERYLAVVHPITFLRYRPERYRLGWLAVVWVGTFVGCSCCLLLSFPVLIKVILPFMLVLLTLKSYCGLAMLQALRRPAPGAGGSQYDKQKAFRIIALHLILTFAGYVPLMVVIPPQGMFSLSQFYNAYAISLSASTFCAFIHPIHYLSRAGKLQCIMGY